MKNIQNAVTGKETEKKPSEKHNITEIKICSKTFKRN